MARHRVTYTSDHLAALSDEFDMQSILAYTDKEAALIIHNIERFFGGTTICCEEEVKPRRLRKRENSDKRKDVRRRRHSW
jgi:hypothetical protein